MKSSICMFRSPLLSAALLTLAAGTAHADVVIEFTGMNLVYDGSSLYDAGSTAGGLADPADADALASVDFFSNGTLVGALSSDISLDVFIPDVLGIPSNTGSTTVLTTPGNPGFFDLLIGTSPLASEFLILDLSSVSITFIDIAGVIQFTFGAALADSFAQNLPFGLIVGDPLSVSFSAQIDPGSLTTAGGFVTGFTASGTGEYRGPLVPAPGSSLLMAMGTMAVVRRRRA